MAKATNIDKTQITGKDYSNVVTQSEIVSANMITIVVIEVIFAAFSVI